MQSNLNHALCRRLSGGASVPGAVRGAAGDHPPGRPRGTGLGRIGHRELLGRTDHPGHRAVLLLLRAPGGCAGTQPLRIQLHGGQPLPPEHQEVSRQTAQLPGLQGAADGSRQVCALHHLPEALEL